MDERRKRKEDKHKPGVRVEKLVPGGAGIGFMEGRPVFIDYTAPGDLVVPEGIRNARGVSFARPGPIIEGSRLRRDPPCPWFGDCGGCQWMHMTYQGQVGCKADVLGEALRGIAGMDLAPDAIHASPSEFGCRYRARLHISGGKAGFFRKGSRKLVTWDRCLLLPAGINGAARVLRNLLAARHAPVGMMSCEISSSPVGGGVTLDWVVKGRAARKEAVLYMDHMEHGLGGAGHVVLGQSVHDPAGNELSRRGGSLTMRVRGLALEASPGTFFQVNPAVNDILVDRVLDHLLERGTRNLLDLYCGNGNFSLPAAASGMDVTGVESHPGAVRDAMAGHPKGCRFLAMDAGRYLQEAGEACDAAIMDPPRTGLPVPVTDHLCRLGFPFILYISCEPATLARDLVRFVESGYAVTTVEVLDMFPQTSHCEVLVAMERRDRGGS